MNKAVSSLSTPKYAIGDTVTCPKTLYNETEGEIVEVERIFKEWENGKFRRGGLCTSEDTIPLGCLPTTFDGVTLVVSYPKSILGEAKDMVSKFYGYAYTIRTPKGLTVFSEKSLKKLNG